jgi:thioredoxin-like negative regulator of GroEL
MCSPRRNAIRMNKTPITIALIICLLSLAQAAMAQDAADSLQGPAVQAGIDWLTDYSEAVAKAGSTDHHIIAEFYTDWCPWCRKMEDSTLTNPQVIALNERFVFLRINAELDTAVANRFKIGGYPTVILLEKAGNEVDRVLGYQPAQKFVETMEGYLAGKGTLWTLEKDNREKTNDPKTIYAIGEKHLERGNFAEARAQFQRLLGVDMKNESGYADNAQFALALIHRKERSWYKAVEAFRTLITDYPESELAEDAQIYVGWLFAQAGDTSEALKSYRKFLKDYSKSTETDWVKQQIQLLERTTKDKS